MDITLHFSEKGSGDVLVLLHGNGEDSGYFRHQIDRFSNYRRVISVDTRGHGASPRGTAPFTIRQFARDLYGLLTALGVEKVSILGFSDGGNIAMVFAMEHPEMVDRLILNGANLSGSGVKFTVQLPIILGYHIASFCAKKDPRARKKAELLALMVKDPALAPDDLKKINAPTLVIAGSRDMIREKHTRLIAESLPQGRLVILPGDHFLANKNPIPFNREVEAFLNETNGTGH